MTSRARDLLDIVWMYALLAALGWWVADTVEGDLVLRAGAADLDNFWQNAWNVRDFDAFPLAGEIMDELRRRLDATRQTTGRPKPAERD